MLGLGFAPVQMSLTQVILRSLYCSFPLPTPPYVSCIKCVVVLHERQSRWRSPDKSKLGKHFQPGAAFSSQV